ncbi:PAS domain S-box-containing protein [Desulfacinum infernum DSM 9756]|uniref:PAS domain S-box-containing protein n=1 Tax=Desulfacinum infernum DSM 9756 TaxID=1121391 RepID=A0A1M4Z3U2_9BACT|nr:sigma-54-dependent Fis family transcriptional regulator [Desulfacinum infernum]SHF12743.1 PAS domain S-box-containing protein [Desulfacinum infernum DSM 9756]
MKPILVIAPHPKVLETVAQATRNNEKVHVRYGLLEDAVPLALEAQSQGAQVIISRGGTTRLLERSELAVPVVDIPVSPFNILSALHQARNFSRTITVMGSVRILRGVEKLQPILDVDLEIHQIYNRAEAEAYVRNRMQSPNPIQVLLGGAIAESLAQEYGLPTVFLETTREDIETALEEAYRLLEVRRIEAQKTEQFKAILQNINHGVIAVDKEGTITTFNRAAAKITGVAQPQAEGRRLQHVLPSDPTEEVIHTGLSQLGHLMRIGRTMVLANRVPVKVGGEIVGAVETLEDVTKIREYENIIRVKLAEKGHVAQWTFDDIIGRSPAIRETVRLARKYAEVDSVILIEGESGTGKEVFAQAIHSAGRRRAGPFVAVNCGAIPDTLIESELFGYEAGAFSGARRQGKDGLFTQAHTGTIFLDEISETSPRFQTTLLRVIQEMTVRPLGSDKVVPIDVRIIAATNRRLKREVERGNFRRDLYFRLNILRLNVPPLRLRKEDIPDLVRHFIRLNATRLGKDLSISREAMELLQNYDWPGNIRELQNVLERLCVTCDMKIDANLAAAVLEECRLEDQASSERIDSIRRNHILEVLRQCGNNKRQAAEKLGISRTTLWRELKRHRLS